MKKHDVVKPNVQEMADKRDIGGLIEALKYEEAPVRSSSTEALKIVKEVERINLPLPEPEDAEDDTDGQIEEARILNMIMGGWRRTSLKWVFRDKDWCIRGNAAATLGQIRDTNAVIPLIQVLEDEDSYVRGEAALALGRIKDARAVEPLTWALGDEDKYVQMTAACALGMLMDKVPTKPSPALKGQLEAKGVDE